MDDWQWRAWVGTRDRGKLGAAFLVTPTRLLTCAHTVLGLDEARVGFPGLREDLPAKVVARGGWRRLGDDGDVAVLELAEPVPYEPARLADPEDVPELAGGGRTLGVYGFPIRSDDNERYATITTDPHWLVKQEWWQLQTAPGYALEEGYSGSAVYDTATGTVVGMVTNAELGDHDRAELGWMLPLSRIRTHWEELDDVLPLRWLTPDARGDLRRILDGIPYSGPLAADLERAAGRPPREEFRSAWASVRYVAEGWPHDPDRLARYLTALGRHLPGARRGKLDAWTARHLRPAPGEAEEEPASIIVRLERLTFDRSYDLTVHTWINGAEGPSQPTVRVPEGEVRGAVQDAVARTRQAVIGRRWMIEFAVPESWLGKPFEQWYVDARNKIPMRMYPVVVRDVDRLRPDSIRRDQAHQRWRVLTGRGRSDPRRVGCDAPRKGSAFHDWLEANTDYCVLVYGARPLRSWLTAALNNGVPVMLWPRTSCTDAAHHDCRGHRAAASLTAAIAGAPPADLPRIALDLRKEALQAPKDEPHCGRELTLLWDDPSRLPDPPLAMEV
ncbi:VMAP-C domain-containing protein [Actinomadura violacea]|uniref:Trypsin-like peptidase domain-containing protein n=1 Tax=Actinomadura violacea TaxID=2819934 RepID=A0ABS3RPD1_9ACTN|nr:trypsin-like peptidase domain-containing protein [Actinomadura violacea]MBO2458593.1 trypsin-like peptidase domain-containing protein [Actinomadura violacea]